MEAIGKWKGKLGIFAFLHGLTITTKIKNDDVTKKFILFILIILHWKNLTFFLTLLNLNCTINVHPNASFLVKRIFSSSKNHSNSKDQGSY